MFETDNYLDEEFLKANDSWVHVGTVMSLHIKPLFLGKTVPSKYYACGVLGLSASLNNWTEIRNNMIVVYNGKSYCIEQNEEMNSKLRNLDFINRNNFEISFVASEMNELVVNVLKLISDSRHITCKASFQKYLVEVNCIDCGEEAAKWISKYLQKSYLRLAYVSAEREAGNYFWNWLEKFQQLEPDDRNIVMPYNSIPRFSLLSYRSLTELNRTSNCNLTLEELNPDICIMPQSMIPFIEFEWEWILIGHAILKNIRPWKRSNIEPKQMPIDMKINMMLMHCALHTRGDVRVGDAVYVRRIISGKNDYLYNSD